MGSPAAHEWQGFFHLFIGIGNEDSMKMNGPWGIKTCKLILYSTQLALSLHTKCKIE